MLSDLEPLAVKRYRHPIVLRSLTVKQVQALSPNYVRICFTSDDLQSFISSSFDDHIKVFFAEKAGQQIQPLMGAEGVYFAENSAPAVARDYTPRAFDTHHGFLEIDFVVHDAGPAGLWAQQAQMGDQLYIAGPRGSMVIPVEYDWHLLVGDESALPAIIRRLEELPSQAIPVVILELDYPELARIIPQHPQLRLQVLPKSTPSQLVSAVKQLELPDGAGYAWVAGESSLSKAIRTELEQTHGLTNQQIKAASYWRA